MQQALKLEAIPIRFPCASIQRERVLPGMTWYVEPKHTNQAGVFLEGIVLEKIGYVSTDKNTNLCSGSYLACLHIYYQENEAKMLAAYLITLS